MGWERKRGKLEELNRLLRGATDTSYDVQVGDARRPPARALLHHARLRHAPPARRARRSSSASSRTRSTGRTSTRAAAASPTATGSCSRASASPPRAPPGSRFARIFAGHTGVDPYTTAVSDTYQDLFGEGSFTGKGLYDVDAFTAALDGRVPDNTLLSHDLFEGLHARTGARDRRRGGRRLPLERPRPRAPPAPLDARRLADPRLAPPVRADARGPRAEPPPAHRALEDLRQPAPQRSSRPRRSSLLLLAWTVLPGSPADLDRRRRGRARVPALPARARGPRRPAAAPAAPAPSCAGSRRTRRAPLARVALQLAFLANQAYAMAHAIVVTLVRLAITRRRLLEWETAAASAARGAGLGGNGPAVVPRRDGGEPRDRARRRSSSSRRGAPGRARRGGARARALGRRAARRAPALASRSRAGTLELGPEDRQFLLERGPHDVEVLRGVHGPGGPRAAAGQLPGGARREDRAPDLADQHRHGAPLHARRARPRLHPRPAELIERIDSHAHHDRGARAARGAPLQLVRHARASRRSRPATSRPSTAATSPARSSRSRGARAARASAAPAEPGPSDACARLESLSRRAAAFADGMSFGFLYDPKRRPLRDRLPRRGRRGARPARSVPLRPPRLGGAARELHRHREGRRPREALVPPRPRGDERARQPDAPVVERDAVRVPHAAARHAELPGHAARRGLPDGGAAPARLRGGARRAVGDLGVRLRRRRSPRQLPVQGVRRPRARPEARPRRRAGGRAVRDRARRARRPHRGGGEPPPPRGGGPARRVRLLRRDRLHAAPARGARRRPAGAGRRCPAGRHDRARRTSPITRG